MILTNDTKWPVYTPAPINPNHPLNSGRVLWLLAIPPLDGGSTYWDLCSQYPGTLSSMTNAANNGWRPPQRSNGFSTLQFDGTAAQVTTGYAGLSGATQFTMAVWGRRLNTSTIGVILQSGSAGSAMCGLQHFSDGRIFFLAGNNSTGAATFTVNDAAWHRIMFVYDGTQASRGVGYVDGKNSGVVLTSAPASIPTLATNFAIGRDITDTRWASGYADDIAIWNRPLTAREAFADYELSLLGYPDVLNRWRPSTLFVSFAASTSAGMAATGSSDTIVASGKLTTLGSISATEAHDTLAGVGKFNTPGSLSKTGGNDTLAASSVFTTSGTLSKTGGNDTLVSAGSFSTHAAIVVTAGNDTLAGFAKLTTPGSLSKTEAHDTLAAIGISGSATAALLVGTGGSDTFAGTARFTTSGSLAKTEGHDNFAGIGIAGNATSGSLAGTGASDSLVANAKFTATASMGATEGHDSLVAIGVPTVFGSMVATSGSDVFVGGNFALVFESSIDPFAATIVPVSVPDKTAALFDAFAASLIQL